MDFIIFVIALIIGFFCGWFLRHVKASMNQNSAEMKAENTLKEAKTKQQELLLAAKEKAINIIDEAKIEEQKRRTEIQSTQQRLEKRESMFDQKLLTLEQKKEVLQKKAEEIEGLRKEIVDVKKEQLAKLEQVAGLDTERAKEVLLKNVEKRMGEALMSRVKKLEQESSEIYDEKARRILIDAIQRCSMSHASDTTSTVIALPSDEMKGRIIGREGRNIKRIEELTGVEVIVDDTPESILISGFSLIRRQVAKRALETLIADGRIHPTRIEESIKKAKESLIKEIKEAGEEVVFDLGIA